MGKVQELIAKLRAEAVEVDAGKFSLDATQARRRLDQSQYIDRGAYLSCVIEGLIGLGAGSIDVRSDGADIIVTVPGLALDMTNEELASLYEKPLADGEDDRSYALGRLAVGIHMALGHGGIGHVMVQSSGTEKTSLALFAPDEDVDVRESAGAEPGVRVMFDRGLVDELMASIGSAAPSELDTARRACRHCETLVDIEGARVSFGMPFVEHGSEHAEEGLRVESGVTRTENEACVVLLSYGVQVEQVVLKEVDTVPGFVALAHLRRPARDLSRIQLIRDEAYERAMTIAEQAHRAIVDSPAFERLRDRGPGRHGEGLGQLSRPRFRGLWVLWLLIATLTAAQTLRLTVAWEPSLEHLAGVFTLAVVTLVFAPLGVAPLVERLAPRGGISRGLLTVVVGLVVAVGLGYLTLILWAPR